MQKTTARKQNLAVWALFCLTAGAVLLVYALIGQAAGGGERVLPLDDVYIHFQYASQIAAGQPYVYNPGQPPTSGATSFLYPYLLAIGWHLGFHDLALGDWALGIGALALLVSVAAVYRLGLAFEIPRWLALFTTLTFALTGPVGWHFMSGMETGLVMALTLLTLLAVVQKSLTGFVVAASLLTLARPEGGIMATIASGTMLLRLWSDMPRHRLLWLVVPPLMIALQPLVNGLLTGSFVASGGQSKSLLATVPRDWGVIIGRIAENVVHMLRDFMTGYAPREGWYLPPLTGPLAFVGVGLLLAGRRWRVVGLLLFGWLLALVAAISTLDTAFWHFKRYQMPLLALFFPLAAYAVAWGLRRFPRLRWPVYAFDALVVPIFVGLLFAQFLTYYAANVGYVTAQPLQMARWLQTNTPEDAVVAVHDVGMMRYMGGRTTLDMVGLTTPGAAEYWRNGPGSVAEFIMRHQPDYIASYGDGHGFGLRLLADTDLYGEPLATFPVDLQPHLNVALAADTQGIYRPDYDALMNRLPGLEINVADLQSERAFAYAWSGDAVGFPTEVQQFATYFGSPQRIVDGLRRITGEESFTVAAPSAGEDVLLITRLHALNPGTLTFYVDDVQVDTQWIPHIPGQWFVLETVLPADAFSGEAGRVRIVPVVPGGAYYPARHTLSNVALPDNLPEDAALITYQDKSFGIVSVETQIVDETRFHLTLNGYADGNTAGDYRLFVHLYADMNQPPVRGYDAYLDAGRTPLGNLRPGAFTEQMVIRDVPPGTYTLAIGFYNRQTNERLTPVSDTYTILPDGRLILGEVEFLE